MAAEFELDRPGRQVITPRAQGGLGYAIPGVVGARMARPQSPVIGLCGDGSFAMSAGDLATIGRIGGPTIVILFNNGCYGWIKALQHFYHGSRYFSVDFPEALSYVQVAQGFGLRGREVVRPDDIGPALREALDYGGPSFIEIRTAPEHEVIPPVASWQRAADKAMSSSS
jgi:acetolactate synthase-1/2/3 large subunit